MPVSSFYRQLAACILFIALLSLEACKKDAKEDARPATGSITGAVDPVDGTSAITATNQATHQTTTVASVQGTFTFNDLAPGTYVVEAIPAPGYGPVATFTVTVTAGKTVTAGYFNLNTNYGGGGTVTFNADGVPVTILPSTIYGVFDGTNLILAGTSTTGNTTAELYLNLYNNVVTGPGTYPLGPDPDLNALATYSLKTGTAAPLLWGADSTGSVRITALNTTQRKMSGTFSFTSKVHGGGGAPGSKAITNGVFTGVGF